MTVNYTRVRADQSVTAGTIDSIFIGVKGIDDADTDIDTNQAYRQGSVPQIPPIVEAALTQADVDAAETEFRATVDDNGDSIDIQIANEITKNQGDAPVVSPIDYPSLPAT